MPENTRNNPGLVISEGIGIQRYKTVVTEANKLFKAFFKEMNNEQFLRVSDVHVLLLYLQNELKGRTEVYLPTELSLH